MEEVLLLPSPGERHFAGVAHEDDGDAEAAQQVRQRHVMGRGLRDGDVVAASSAPAFLSPGVAGRGQVQKAEQQQEDGEAKGGVGAPMKGRRMGRVQVLCSSLLFLGGREDSGGPRPGHETADGHDGGAGE